MTDNITAEDRWAYMLDNPANVKHLLSLLEVGKGTKDDFTKMIDRIIKSERAAAAA
ncbi:MAG: hypothetical protein OEQ29_08890 [Alphaproteobacteria bacterium]|nr:hypothetical protein [Alphaproteobacteria bacterium]